MKKLLALIVLVVAHYTVYAQGTLVSQFDFNNNLVDNLSNGTLVEYNNATSSYNSGVYSFIADSSFYGGGVIYNVPDADLDEEFFSIAIRFQLSETSGYRKFMDFGNMSSDRGIYINTQLRLYNIGSFGATSIAPNSFITVFFTREIDDTCKIYLQQGSSLSLESIGFDTDGSFLPELLGGQRVIHFFHDDSTTLSEFASMGSVDYIKVWNGIPTNLSDILSAQTLDKTNYTIFPNPSSDVVHIQLSSPYNGVIQVSDINGKVFSETSIDESTLVDINIEALPSGVYFIRGNGIYEKLIKE